MHNTQNYIFISYPSGGFGNFVYHVITTHFQNVYKINNDAFEFGADGNSHSTVKHATPWFHDPDNYSIAKINTNKSIVILVDNGINNDSYHKLNNTFNDGKIIRLIIDRPIRPVIFKTMSIKSQGSSPIIETLSSVLNKWSEGAEDYAIRENFTLLYKNWPFGWQPVNASNIINVNLSDLIQNPLETFINLAELLDDCIINVDDLKILIKKWQESNLKYFHILEDWKIIEDALDNKQNIPIAELELHDQGYINYCIEEKFNVIIPVYDYKNWFKNTNEIIEMIRCLK